MTTATKGLSQPANGSLVGVWDVPVNGNMTIIDNALAGMATIGLSGSNVVLTAAQAQCMFIRFTGTLTTNVNVYFPAGTAGVYTIINECINNQAFYVLLVNQSTNTYIGAPPGTTDIANDGTWMRFRSLPPIGTYLHIAANGYFPWMGVGSPWIPYLNCDGQAFNTGLYYQLAAQIGGVLPDLRGRMFLTTDQGTGRVTSVIGSVYSHAGGNQFLQSHAHGGSGSAAGSWASGYNLDHSHTYDRASAGPPKPTSGGTTPFDTNTSTNSGGASYGVGDHAHSIGVSVSAAGGGAENMPPCFIGGLTLIRAGQ